MEMPSNLDYRTKTPGVYRITNTVNGRKYYGNSKDIAQRFASHKSHCKHHQHKNSLLYQQLRAFGLDNFEFEVLVISDNKDLRNLLEDKLIKHTHYSRRMNSRSGGDSGFHNYKPATDSLIEAHRKRKGD